MRGLRGISGDWPRRVHVLRQRAATFTAWALVVTAPLAFVLIVWGPHGLGVALWLLTATGLVVLVAVSPQSDLEPAATARASSPHRSGKTAAQLLAETLAAEEADRTDAAELTDRLPS